MARRYFRLFPFLSGVKFTNSFRYDSRTTTFSPEGRLYQVQLSHRNSLQPVYYIKTKVEYALEAINRAGTAVGIRTKNGIILAAEKKILSKVRLNAYLFFAQLFVEVVGKFVHKREATSNR